MTMVLRPIPEDAPHVFLEQFIDPILAKIDDEDAVHLTKHGSQALRARRYRLDNENQILYLLINFSDTNVTDPAFENLETGALRVEPKLHGEGVAISTYMAIDLQPHNDRTPHYRVILEDVPGIGRTKLCPFLTYLVRTSDVRVEWPDPEGKKRVSRPDFALEGTRSQTLEEDMADGKLSFIELVRYRPDAEFDEEGVLQQEKAVFRLKVKSVPDDDKVVFLNRIKNKAFGKGYTEMRVGYSPEKEKSKTIDFGTAREDVADVLTIRTSEVRLADQRMQCETEIRDDVVERIQQLVLDRRDQEC